MDEESVRQEQEEEGQGREYSRKRHTKKRQKPETRNFWAMFMITVRNHLEPMN